MFQGSASETAESKTKDVWGWAGGTTCRGASTQTLRDLSSKNNFLADRSTAGKMVPISTHTNDR